MLGFFFRHYEPWVDRFVFFDDGSTDGTLDLLRSKPNVEVRAFRYSDPGSFIVSQKAILDQCWKESRGVADWVVLVDADEFVHHPQILPYLQECKRRGITYMPCLGFNMIADNFPQQHENLAQSIVRGAESTYFCKLRVFDPVAIEATNFGHGSHDAAPAGRLALPERDELTLLHYKYLGYEHLQTRYAALGDRMRASDRANRWGLHYFASPESNAGNFARLKSLAIDLSDPRYLPWRDHGAPRWWRSELTATSWLVRLRRRLRAFLALLRQRLNGRS